MGVLTKVSREEIEDYFQRSEKRRKYPRIVSPHLWNCDISNLSESCTYILAGQLTQYCVARRMISLQRSPDYKEFNRRKNFSPKAIINRRNAYLRIKADPAKHKLKKARAMAYFMGNKKKVYAYRNARRKADPQYKIACNLRTYLYQRVGGNNTGQSRFNAVVGCTIEEFRLHLEKQFKPGMSWDNYGKLDGKWSIDHIKPCASFDLTDEEQLKACFHYSNMQPMWWRENLAKRDKVL